MFKLSVDEAEPTKATLPELSDQLPVCVQCPGQRDVAGRIDGERASGGQRRARSHIDGSGRGTARCRAAHHGRARSETARRAGAASALAAASVTVV